MAETDVTEKTFVDEVLMAPGLVIVDYWADWCAPCKQMSPILDAQTSHNQSYSYFSGEAVGSGAVGGSWVELLVGLGWGVAGAILTEIIATARRAGLTALNLETGVAPYFASARRLYERHGFTIRGPFADYTDDLLSIYYGLPLTTLTPVAR